MVDKKDLYENIGKNFMGKNDEVTCQNDAQPETKLQRIKRLGFWWCSRQHYWKLRKNIGSTIIGNPKYGKGILLQIPLGHMDQGQKNSYYEADKLLGHAGIGCDSGMGGGSGVLDLEWDWSLHGAFAKCKRCGYDTRDHVREYVRASKDKHYRMNRPECRDGRCCHTGDLFAREELGY